MRILFFNIRKLRSSVYIASNIILEVICTLHVANAHLQESVNMTLLSCTAIPLDSLASILSQRSFTFVIERTYHMSAVSNVNHSCVSVCLYVCMYENLADIVAPVRLCRLLQKSATTPTYIHTYIHTYSTCFQ